MPILTIDHLEFLLEYRGRTNKFHLLSATKQKKVNDLVAVKCLQFREEDNDTVWITQLGIHVINSAFNEWLNEIRACTT